MNTKSRWDVSKGFAAVPFETKGRYFQSRYYQDIAVERVTEAIAAGTQRSHLTFANDFRARR